MNIVDLRILQILEEMEERAKRADRVAVKYADAAFRHDKSAQECWRDRDRFVDEAQSIRIQMDNIREMHKE